MSRMQKTEFKSNPDCPCEDRVELEGNKGVQNIASLEKAEEDGAESLLDKLLHRDNLNLAYKKVKKNGGAPGIDGMTVEEMLPYLKEHREEIVTAIRNGKYKPKPVRRVEIPKPDGGVRMLGVPTVIDRMIQQAIAQVLQPIFEPIFSDNSYGFRPGRSAHHAIMKSREYYEQGYRNVVDIDLAKYFDTVNHDVLTNMLREEISDKDIIRLIRAFLKSGVMADGIVKPTEEGTPQGGNLSPLLSNIYLNKFDKMLEERGHKFVRYADDCNIYLKSQRAAERVMTSSVEFLEGKLRLKVNQEKSKVGSPLRLKFLGFSLYTIKGKVGIRPHQKSVKKFKARVKQITKRNRGRSIDKILMELKLYTWGWINYYGIADMRTLMEAANQWLRRRIRMYIWKQW